MKRYLATLASFLVLISLFGGSFALEDEEQKTSDDAVTSGSDNPAILKNEIILTRDANNYTEVRHIALKGTNEQIGKALGEIARDDYNAKPGSFVDPVYARARLTYM